MLDIKAMQMAINQEKNAGGFADLMKQFMMLGVTQYDYLVSDGIYRFSDGDVTADFQMNGVPKTVSEQSSAEKITAAVRSAQAGQISFETFCDLAGQAGVSYWTSDLTAKRVSYYDARGKVLLSEPIPGL
ncbi:DUF1398 family protein [Lactococcus insecticola]|uniref:DUF1398 domain-containing protein n=1 Tax=Pseudolactococcus insecticola TaxID=2709158 RepID=A0A6A0B699_9LACT|nr:DUF1398 family protein [Lactococcus insecticola]GFH40051.1 DUF1398 domain-containing protein [Lactococcus insecticola]